MQLKQKRNATASEKGRSLHASLGPARHNADVSRQLFAGNALFVRRDKSGCHHPLAERQLAILKDHTELKSVSATFRTCECGCPKSDKHEIKDTEDGLLVVSFPESGSVSYFMEGGSAKAVYIDDNG